MEQGRITAVDGENVGPISTSKIATRREQREGKGKAKLTLKAKLKLNTYMQLN